MGALLLLHLIVGLGLLAAGKRSGRFAFACAAVPMAVTYGWLLTKLADVVDGAVLTEHADWIPQLGLSVDLRLDGFSAVMVSLVAGIGVLVIAYADGYFRPHGATAARLLGLLVLFAGSMLGLVLADNLLVLYGFWELTSITSFLLIGHKSASATARAAALQALLVTGLGGLAMLGGFIVIGQAGGTYRLERAARGSAVRDRLCPSASCSCCSGRSRSRRSFRSTAGCPERWSRRRPSAPTCTRPRW